MARTLTLRQHDSQNISATSSLVMTIYHPPVPSSPPKLVGSYWIWIYKGKEWPVLLCGDAMSPQAFVQTRRHPSEVPAILFGKRVYIWVIEERLMEYEPHRDYILNSTSQIQELEEDDDAETKLEKQRVIAFRRDAPEMQTPAFWVNWIDVDHKLRKHQRQTNTGPYSRRQRKRSADNSGCSELSFSPKKKRGSSDRRDSGSYNADFQCQLPPPIKQQGSVSGLPIRTKIGSAEYWTGGEDSLSHARRLIEQGNAVMPDSEECKALRQKHEQSIIDDPPAHGFITVFVGITGIPFQLAQDAVGNSDVLSERTRFDDKLQSHINISDMAHSVSEKHFMRIAEYMCSGDFSPRTVFKNGCPPRLEGLALPDERNKAAEDIVCVYSAASHLQLAGLQALCVEKLRMLYPLATLQLLIVAKSYQRSWMWGCDAEGELLDWLADHIAEYYKVLMKYHDQHLALILKSNVELHVKVFEKLEDPNMGTRGMDDDDEE